MRSSAAAGGIAGIVFGVAGLAWTVLQFAPVSLGFEDTDNPAVSLAYLRVHFDHYLQQGLAMFVMALALTVLVFAVWDLLAGRIGSLGLRTVSAFGLMAAGSFFLVGVMRYSVLPLLHIDGLDSSWGETAYLVQQVAGTQGFGQAGIFTMCAWAVGVGVLGYRSRAVPRWLALLALLPALRLLGGVGPILVDAMPGELWIVFMVAIPGSLIWFILLGAVLLRRGLRSTRSEALGAAAA